MDNVPLPLRTEIVGTPQYVCAQFYDSNNNTLPGHASPVFAPVIYQPAGSPTPFPTITPLTTQTPSGVPTLTPSPTPTAAPGVPGRPGITLLLNQCISGTSEQRLSQMTINWTINPPFSGDLTVQISEGSSSFGNPFTKLLPAQSGTGFSTNFANFENPISGTPLTIRPDTSYFIRVCLQRGTQTICGDPNTPSLRIPACSTTPTPGYACLYRPVGSRTPGDANSDNRVGLRDYSTWWSQLYGSNRVPANASNFADFNCNGQIDIGDLTLWEQNYTGEN